ncbi:MAG: rhodanese-like domain-containing protein, partial [Crocinitomicaceae bacterium]|nr:rhodanese-like domain-containing protein [Crocinitomicaceae bacterium]
QFAPWVGAVIKDTATPLLLMVEEDQVEEAITRLARVGFDNVHGYLKNGIEAWAIDGKNLADLESISARDLEAKITNEKAIVFDVRKDGEYEAEHLGCARFTPLDDLDKYLDEYPENDKFYLHCAGGYRSVIALSILKANGFHTGINVLGGFGAIKDTGLKISEFVCPSTKA